MMNEKSILVAQAPNFERLVARLKKKYPHVDSDLESLIIELMQGKTPGDQMTGVGYTVFKTRVNSHDLKSGKRGGFRVVYYLKTRGRIYLITIYPKPKKDNITSKEVSLLIKEFEQYLSSNDI